MELEIQTFSLKYIHHQNYIFLFSTKIIFNRIIPTKMYHSRSIYSLVVLLLFSNINTYVEKYRKTGDKFPTQIRKICARVVGRIVQWLDSCCHVFYAFRNEQSESWMAMRKDAIILITFYIWCITFEHQTLWIIDVCACLCGNKIICI